LCLFPYSCFCFDAMFFRRALSANYFFPQKAIQIPRPSFGLNREAALATPSYNGLEAKFRLMPLGIVRFQSCETLDNRLPPVVAVFGAVSSLQSHQLELSRLHSPALMFLASKHHCLVMEHECQLYQALKSRQAGEKF